MKDRDPLWGKFPETIQLLLDNGDPGDRADETAPCITEYTYSTTHPETGEIRETSLLLQFDHSPDPLPLPRAGTVITVNDVRVKVVSAGEVREQITNQDFSGVRTYRTINIRGLDRLSSIPHQQGKGDT
ncbi:hypothetical protein ABT282_08380 [Streptomyces sp. NPDC000927]|uniref:hypothetical protein n=1 Tax=Streptomyces sp. NPDC000927 TaxID=3154371 RepID=UPI00331EF4E7